MTGSFVYGNAAIDFQVLYAPRKTMEIAVHPDGSVVVKAPFGTVFDAVEQRVQKRARWIKRQLDYFRQFEPRTPQRWYVSGETHLYLGRQYRLRVTTGNVREVRLTRGHFEVTTPDSSPEKVKALLEKWYAQKAASRFGDSFEHCWPHFHDFLLPRPKLQVRRMKSRWGSLSRGGILTLNPALVRAPRECIDYVITHELCHLKCHDHSAAFYSLLEKVMPDWAKRKHRLELTLV